MAIGESTAAVSSRVYFICLSVLRRTIRFDEHLGVGFVHSAVAAFARLEIDDRFEKVAPPEIGPQDLVDVNLGVRDLPQQEIRYPQLAAGADQQIGVVDVG